MRALDESPHNVRFVGSSNEFRTHQGAHDILPFSTRKWPLKCLVHDIQELPPAPHGLEYVRDAEVGFDIVLASGRELSDLDRTFERCSNPAAPLVVTSDGFGPRADVVVTESTPSGLASAIATMSPLFERLAKLPPVPSGIDRNGLLALALGYSRDCSIEAQWQPGRPDMVDYPLLLGIVDPRPVLEELADAGLLRRRFFERLHICERCHSSRLHAREVCVACHSSHLAENALVHHYACGFQAPQPLFEDREGYLCPKCRKQLRHYGVDYDKPGNITTCKGCGETMAEPEVGFVCLDCGGYTSGERAGHRDWFHYDLLPDGIAALRSGGLPHSDLAECSRSRLSLRDFRLLADHNLQVAQRYHRPLTACRVTLDIQGLEKNIGPRGLAEVCQLLRDVISNELRNSDALATLPVGFVVCLPETNRSCADHTLRRMQARIAEVVHPKIALSVETFEGDKVAALLQELR